MALEVGRPPAEPSSTQLGRARSAVGASRPHRRSLRTRLLARSFAHSLTRSLTRRPPVRPLALAPPLPLSKSYAAQRERRSSSHTSPLVNSFFFSFIKGDVTVSSLPPRYVTGYHGAPQRVPRLHHVPYPQPHRRTPSPFTETYPTSLLSLLSTSFAPSCPCPSPPADPRPPPRCGKRERRTAS